MLTAMLMESKATVQTASNVSEALDLLQLLIPDVIVSDLALPFEDGYSLIAKIRKLEAASGKQIPAVALTAYIRVEDRAKALAAGFNMFVPKPVEPNELVAAISHLTKPGAIELS
jgi:CheY-like chemotaxis protein